MTGIATRHPEYDEFAPRWRETSDALGGQDVIRAAGTRYLPKTGGMRVNDAESLQYNAYRQRARFLELASTALTAMIGLVFEKDPIGASDEIITNTGQTNLQLARDVVRPTGSKGRDVLVVDAPRGRPGGFGGGTPFLARYAAESFINWKTAPGNDSELTLGVFVEHVDVSGDEYGHDTVEQYRRYRRDENGRVELTVWRQIDGLDVQIGETLILPVSFMPIEVIGSIDSQPACDPVPLLPIARCAVANYMKSADFENALHRVMQPTPWLAGVEPEQYDQIREQGYGSSSLWYLGPNAEAKAGFLEPNGSGLKIGLEAMDREVAEAEKHSVRLAQASDAAESGVALSMRAATQHASIYGIADATSIGISRAQRMRAEWGSLPAPDDFQLRTEFTPAYAAETMIQAINEAVNAGNAPRSVLFEMLRRTGLSERSNAEMASEIEIDVTASGDPLADAA